MNQKDSERVTSRKLLLDAVETVMRESGYAAVTSRRVAAQAGLKPQLVHYHFRTMDDLFLAAFRRLATSIIERQDKVDASEKPLRAMWNLLTDNHYRLLISEFVALGNHRPAIRNEFIQFGDELRRKQTSVMTGILASHGLSGFPWSPAFAAILLHSLARFLAAEDELGISQGHREALNVVNWYIERYDHTDDDPIAQRLAELERQNAELMRKLADFAGPE